MLGVIPINDLKLARFHGVLKFSSLGKRMIDLDHSEKLLTKVNASGPVVEQDLSLQDQVIDHETMNEDGSQ